MCSTMLIHLFILALYSLFALEVRCVSCLKTVISSIPQASFGGDHT